jgi:hypothetical protein
MKLTAFVILMFFVTWNVCLYWINETQVLPVKQSPYESPSGIEGKLISVDLSSGNIVIAGTALVMSVLLGWATGHLLFGGTLGILLFGFTILFPVLSWIILGLPRYLQMLGMPLPFYTGIAAILSVLWFWFLMGFLAQRDLTGD